MAFWRYNAADSGSDVDKILERPDHTLVELLEEPELLQELLSPNTKLVEYLRTPEVLEELVALVANKPLNDIEDDGSDGDDDDTDEPTGEKKQNDDKKKEEDDEDEEAISEDIEKDEPDSDEEAFPDHDDDDDDDDVHHHFRRGSDESDSISDNQKQALAHVAAEILSSGVWSLTEALMQSTEYLDRIWTILDYPVPLEISYASSFTKINEKLLEKKTSELLNYIMTQKDFVKKVLRHMDNPPIMDFLLKVLATDKWGNYVGIIDFLQSQKLIPSLISFLGPEVSSPVQSAAGDFLKAFVTMSANSNTENNTLGPNELSRELVSEPVVKELIRLMLHGGTGLATGVGVVIEIIRKNNSDYDFVPVMYITMESHPPGPRDPIYLGTLVKLFAQNVPNFQALLNKERKDKLQTTFGEIEPLGFERFKVCELFAELLHCSNMTLLNDPNGEKVVKERDQERDRVKNMIAKVRDEADTEDTEHDADAETDLSEAKAGMSPTTPGRSVETGLESLDIQTDKFLDVEDSQQNKDSDTEMHSPSDDSPTKPKEIKSDDDEQDWDQQTNSAQSEESIRAHAVVGDQLKIALADNGCIPTILTMFFNFPWNNFLHNVVFDICQQVLNGPMNDGFNRFLAIDLFGKAHLTDVICKGHAECEKFEAEHNMRLGYMGHLTLISEEVVKFTAVYAPETVSQTVVDAVSKSEWIHYVTHTLVKSREQYNAVLGGERPDQTEVHFNPDAIIPSDPDASTNDDDEAAVATALGEELPKDPKRLHDEDEDDEDIPREQPLSSYISSQLSSGAGHHGTKTEDEDDDELENASHDNDNEDDEDDESNELNDDDDEDDEDDDQDDLNLTRSRSKHETDWDAEEEKRFLMNQMISKSHASESSS